MTKLYFYDDARAREFEPFALTRPVSELRIGADTLRKRWERVFGAKAAGFIGASHLKDFEEFDTPSYVAPTDVIPAGSIIINSRFAIAFDSISNDADAFECDGEICAIRVGADIKAGDISFESKGKRVSLKGNWYNEVWDLVAKLSGQLNDDIPKLAKMLKLQPSKESNVVKIGDGAVYHEAGVDIGPYTVFDVTAGPILLRRGAVVAPFTRINGPCVVGEHSTVLGDPIAACSIGDYCKIRGEISNTVVLGHSNKGHYGFVGHSYLGRWVNLGAGTTTSNLKNTYGTVTLRIPKGEKETGEQFLGTLFGDHVKTGIGKMLNTGTMLGAGANVFGDGMPPKYVAPFSWGGGGEGKYDIEKFCSTAERMMQRRDVKLSEKQRVFLRAAYASLAHDRVK